MRDLYNDVALAFLIFGMGMLAGAAIALNSGPFYHEAQVYTQDGERTVFITKQGNMYAAEYGYNTCPDDVPYLLRVDKDNNVMVVWRAAE